ncbi:hypothetical protein BGY98DRAFT_936844 [Russula aff. rugulosa BPL654]|nr:hypothetical protein BGY98DRAFT_936844 [Russula aff. rugulosa BPL654]
MCPKAYQASTRLKNGRESLQNVHCWIKPFGPSFIATPGLIQSLNLLLKDNDNVTRSVTGLEPGGEWLEDEEDEEAVGGFEGASVGGQEGNSRLGARALPHVGVGIPEWRIGARHDEGESHQHQEYYNGTKRRITVHILDHFGLSRSDRARGT